MVIQITDQTLAQAIEKLAVAEQREPEAILADAIRLYTTQTQKTSGVQFLLSIAGQGASQIGDVSERDEAILADEVDPIRGWSVRDDAPPSA